MIGINASTTPACADTPKSDEVPRRFLAESAGFFVLQTITRRNHVQRHQSKAGRSA